MPDERPNPVTEARRHRWKVHAGIGIIVVAIITATAGYLTGPHFNLYVRNRLIAAIDESTGGHTTIAGLKWNISKLEIELRDITVRGTEPRDQQPFAHIDRLFVRLKIFSLLQGDYGVRYLEADRPTFNVITYPDGTTNLPVSKQKRTDKPVDQLFHLAMERAEIHSGLIFWNDKPAPLELTANDIVAFMTFGDNRYEGRINVGKLDANFQDMRPIAANAEIEFALLPRSLTLKAFRAGTGASNIEASGQLENFDNPDVKLVYNATIDLREAGFILRNPTLRGGTAQLNAKGTFTQGNYFTDGRVLVKNGQVQLDQIRLSGVEAGGNFNADKARLNLNLVAHTLGGTITVEAAEVNWLSSPVPALRGSAPPQRGSAHLVVRGVQVASAANAVSTSSIPLNKVKLAGTMAGTINVAWTGAITEAVSQITLDAVPPAHPTADQLPVTAHLRASLNTPHQSLDVTQLDVTTRAARLNASGSVGRANANLKVGFTTSYLGELKPLLAAFGGPTRLPLELAGTATFDGMVSGALKSPRIAGHLDIENFDSLIEVASIQPANPRVQVAAKPALSAAETHEVRLHWERATADIQYGAGHVALQNAVLQHGKNRITGSAQATLQNGSLTENSPFTARLDLTNADIAELQAIAGYSYPITGTANASLAMSGTIGNPHATGKIQITGATVSKEKVSSITADLEFTNHVAELRNLALVENQGRITGTATVGLQTKALLFDLRGTGIDLSKLQFLQTKRAIVSGIATFAAQGSGTLQALAINGNLRIEDVVINGEKVGNIAVDAVTHGEEMRITGSTHYQNAQLLVNGTVRLRNDYPVNLHLRFTNVDIDPLLRAYLQGRVTGHSSLAGDVQVEGPLQRWRELNATGTINQVSVELASVKLKNDGPVRFTMARQELRLEQFKVVGDGTELTATGTIQLSGAQRMDLTANGHLNLLLIQTLNPAYNSSGQLTLAVQARGTLSKPSLAGNLQIANGAISYIDLPNGLSNINGTMVFNQDRLQVESLVARSGGGALKLGGFIAYSNGMSFNLTATADDIRLRYPPGVSAGAGAELRLTGTLKNSTLAGDVTITRFALNPRFDFSLYLARAKQPPTVPDPNSALNGLHLDVHIVSTPALEVQTSLGKLSGDLDLRLRGTGTRPVVLGRVNIVEGDVFFNGTTYHLERGDITFTNPVRIEPILNVEATARVRDYDITLGFHGPMDRLATTYRSEPPLPTGDIIALLAFGRTRTDTALNPQPTPNFTETASNAVLGQALNAVVSNRVQKLFGVSRIKIDPQVGTATTNPTARITIEQQVSDKITLTYITDVTQSTQQVIQLEYNVNRSVSVTAVRDQYGVVGFDVRIRQRKK
jgi:translocation and assembly module TamB